MKFFKVFSSLAFFFWMPFLFIAVTKVEAQTTVYTVTDLGTLGGTSSYAYAVNDSGQVVGQSQTNLNGSGVSATLFSLNSSGIVTVTNLGTLGGDSVAYGINDAGQIVGASDFSPTMFFPNGSAPTNLCPANGEAIAAYAINQNGFCSGLMDTENQDPQSGSEIYAGCIYSNSPDGSYTAYELGNSVQTGETADSWPVFAVNDLDAAVGCEYVYGLGTTTSDDSTTTYDYSYLSATSYGYDINNNYVAQISTDIGSAAFGVNNAGWIVGVSQIKYGQDDFTDFNSIYDLGRATLWTNGLYGAEIVLGSLSTNYPASLAVGINNANEVVGVAQTTNGIFHGFVWNSATGLQDINSLIISNPGVTNVSLALTISYDLSN